MYQLLRSKPYLFVGRLPNDIALPGGTEKLARGVQERDSAYEQGSGDATRKVVHFLFPEVATAEEGFSMGSGSYAEGVISHPSRLVVALQLGITDGDVSIRAARQYLESPAQREQILSDLKPEVCHEFLDMLGEVGCTLQIEELGDLAETCVSIARLIDSPAFVERAKHRDGVFGMSPDDLALRQIKRLTGSCDEKTAQQIYMAVAVDPRALTCATELLRASYVPNQRRYDSDLPLDPDKRAETIKVFADNVLSTTKGMQLFETNMPSRILWTLARLAPQICKKIFRVIETADETLDKFALHFLRNSWDSSKGQAYGLPPDEGVTQAYCPLKTLQRLAASRLQDPSLRYPTRAAWQSVLEGKSLYGVDGADATR